MTKKKCCVSICLPSSKGVKRTLLLTMRWLIFPQTYGDRGQRASRTQHGCCSSICASRNGTSSNIAAWDNSVKAFRKDLKAMQKLVRDPRTDLYAPIPWGDGQTILREALLIADHNAYHLGQLVALRRLLGTWKE